MAQRAPLVVAGIPALNEEAAIAKVVIGAQRHVGQVVVYDDGSTDMTGAIAERLGATVIRGDQNLGKGAGLRSIFQKARELGADVLVTIDGDGQHDPNEIPRLVEELGDSGADVVIGSRFIANASSIPNHRRAGNVLLSFMTEGKLDGVTDTQSGFRAYGKKAIAAIRPGERGMSVDSEILMDARDMDLRLSEVPISVSYEGKTSKHHPVYHGLDVLASVLKLTSIRHPLIFYGIPGLIAFVVGIVLASAAFADFTLHAFLDTNLVLVAFSALFVGLLSMFTAVILFTISTVVRKRD